METIAKLLDVPITKGDVGIEIELEGEHLPRDVNKFWRVEYDGSLNDSGLEYVLTKPLSIKQAKYALSNLKGDFKHNKAVVDDSVRAGVHVHINVQELTLVELYNFITLYVILEELLVKFCGKTRQGNLFCLRIKDAEYLMEMIKQSIEEGNLSCLNTQMIRYSSMNLNAISKYGSVEFRAMRGSDNFGLIYTWAEMLLSLREYARKFDSPAQMISVISSGTVSSFLYSCLGNNAKRFGRYNKVKPVKAGMLYARHISSWHTMAERLKINNPFWRSR